MHVSEGTVRSNTESIRVCHEGEMDKEEARRGRQVLRKAR